MVGSGAPGARRRDAGGRPDPRQRALAIARGGRRDRARPTPTLVRLPPARTPPEGSVLVAEHQVAGRGRLDRVWTSPPRAGLTVSFLLRPDVPAARRGWLPLLTGVALAEAVGEATGVLRLAEVAQRPARPRRPQAGRASSPRAPGRRSSSASGSTSRRRRTSCPTPGRRWPGAPGRPVDRGPVLLAFLRAVERPVPPVDRGASGDPVASGLAAGLPGLVVHRRHRRSPCTLPDGSTLDGVAEAVDWDGRLVVATADGRLELATGDVHHVRTR